MSNGNPYSQSNYPLTPVKLNTGQIGTKISVSIGGSFQTIPWIVVYNESPFLIQLSTFQGTIIQIQPGNYDKMMLDQGTNVFFITPISFLPTGNPVSEVDINVYPFGEPEGAFPGVNPRQLAPVSGAQKFGYNNAAIVSGAGPFQMFNIFNPSNSGKDYVFYSGPAEIISGTAATDIFLDILAGPDVNLASNAGPGQQHDSNSPASNAHCTFGSGALPGNTVISQPSFIQTQVNVPGQLLQNGDLVVIHSGQNLLMAGSTTTQTMLGQLSWYEQ